MSPGKTWTRQNLVCYRRSLGQSLIRWGDRRRSVGECCERHLPGQLSLSVPQSLQERRATPQAGLINHRKTDLDEPIR